MGFKSVAKFFSVYGVWIACALIFFLSTFFLTRFTHFFISPDETASAFFARAFQQSGSFRVFDVLNQTFGGVLHPRSIITDGAYLIPGSFLGLAFLYGMLLHVFGSWSLTFFTPVLVIVAALAWKQIIERWFSARVAFLSSLLFLFHPAIWYYSARGLMPNVLFVCCIVFSVWFLLVQPKTPLLSKEGSGGNVMFALSGLFLGLALFVRLSEAYWLVPLFLFLIYAVRTSLSVRHVVSIGAGFLCSVGLIFGLNFLTYGHAFTFGYTFVSSVPNTVLQEVSQKDVSERFSLLLPFGFHPRAIFWHTLDYLFLLFWWLTIPALGALGIVWGVGGATKATGATKVTEVTKASEATEATKVRKENEEQKVYIIVIVLIAVWLCVWYGSWRLHDNPDPTQITIANSYVRYWLPVFVMSTPLIATSVVWISERVKSKKRSFLLVCLSLIVLGTLNARIVFFAGQDALVRVVATLRQSEKIRDQIFGIVPEQGVIVTDRSDKLFFPGRRVLVPLRSEQTYATLPLLVEQIPVYYYGITLPEADLHYLNEQKLGPHALHIEFIKTFGVESLYRIREKEKVESIK